VKSEREQLGVAGNFGQIQRRGEAGRGIFLRIREQTPGRRSLPKPAAPAPEFATGDSRSAKEEQSKTASNVYLPVMTKGIINGDQHYAKKAQVSRLLADMPYEGDSK
jgi:hypothetical protein